MYRIIADENIDHRVVHRLRHYGHDIEHVEHVPELGKSTADGVIAAYSLDTGRLLLTNDDDFLREFDASAYRGLLFIEDETLTSETIPDVVHAMSEHIDHEQADGVLYVSTNWL